MCGSALDAARTLLGAHTTMRITDSDPANIECVVSGAGVHLDVNAQAVPRAWDQFDTVVVHQAQAFETGPSHNNPQLPIDLPPQGDAQAVWIPASSQLVATNGTQSSGGSYVTVNVTRRSKRGPASLKVADAVGNATLAVAPRGPNPGPAPS
ncbi:MAG: hypothetical protein JO243_13955 [Solirubrobacterales bacterium]|nr:hypothetical protein [Solirubrobacterales bacterium]